MPTYTICIGSNYNREENLLLARNQLTALFPSIRFADEEETEPFLLSNPAFFTNQVARFQADEEPEQVKSQLKNIERMAGRLPEHKAMEKVVLDIDLLMCDHVILKPKDIERNYIMKGISDLEAVEHRNPEAAPCRPCCPCRRFVAIIPARYASTRFPAKPLAILGGKPVIQRVYEQVAGIFDDAYVATDDVRIEAAVKAFGGKVVMTSVDHNSGTDRCYEAYTKIGEGYDVIVNIQGDEPFIQPSQLHTIKDCFKDAGTHIATLVKPFAADDSFEALENANSPKVVINKNMNALYFSRSIIPYQRNADKKDWLKNHIYYKHIGLYAYRADVLKEITTLPQSSLELSESLEQLRWLENGYTIKVGTTEVETIGIDTPEDLERAEEFLRKQML